MGKVIKFEDKKDYIELKHYATEILRDLHAKIDEIALNLLAYGKWNEWNKKQSEGTIINIEDLLQDLDDKNVIALLNLKDEILKTINIIK